MLRDAVDPRLGGEELIRQFYTKWFAIDMAVRDLFPPDLGTQFTVFSQAMAWLFGELVDQRAEEPVAFLAQLGRDHRKYGVVQSHYFSMHEALYTTLPSIDFHEVSLTVWSESNDRSSALFFHCW